MSDTPNRVRKIYLDCSDGDFPKRGDRIRTNGGTLYWVALSRRVNRKNIHACPRVNLAVITSGDIEEHTKAALLKSALRRGSSRLFPLFWYPRTRKTISFEQYMGAR